MGWSPLTSLVIGCAVWVGLSLLIAWLVGRWFRWLRGDFDPMNDDRERWHIF